MVECIKTCDCCTECENLMVNYPITFVKDYGLYQKSETLVGCKCRLYGQYCETVDGLRDSDLMEDLIFIP